MAKKKTKLNCTPFEEAAVGTESKLDWKVPEEHLMLETAAVVSSLLCHLFVASKLVLVSRMVCLLFYTDTLI